MINIVVADSIPFRPIWEVRKMRGINGNGWIEFHHLSFHSIGFFKYPNNGTTYHSIPFLPFHPIYHQSKHTLKFRDVLIHRQVVALPKQRVCSFSSPHWLPRLTNFLLPFLRGHPLLPPSPFSSSLTSLMFRMPQPPPPVFLHPTCDEIHFLITIILTFIFN